jgi:hypothetical protein
MPEATKTRDQIIDRALRKLTVIGTGQSPDAEEAATIDDALDGIFGDLAAREVVEVADDDAIPSEWFEDLAEIVAQTCAKDFGRAKDQAEIDRAEASLIKKGTPGPTYQRQTTEYF